MGTSPISISNIECRYVLLDIAPPIRSFPPFCSGGHFALHILESGGNLPPPVLKMLTYLIVEMFVTEIHRLLSNSRNSIVLIYTKTPTKICENKIASINK
jgi:hypothetical protein